MISVRKTWINKLRISILSLLLISIFHNSAQTGGAVSFAGDAQIDPARWESLGLQPGDLILRRGNSFVSNLIAQAFPAAKGMSHCGILLKKDGKWQIIHTISGNISGYDGIRIDDLDTFVSKARDDLLYHIKPSFEIDRRLLTVHAEKYLASGAAFDHNFDLYDSDKLYCSELVRAVYLDSGAGDHFSYKKIAGKKLVDLGSFFDGRYWQSMALKSM